MQNKNYKNYTSYSSAKPVEEKKVETAPVEVEAVEEANEDINVESTPVVEETKQEHNTSPVIKPVIGVVSGCVKLNVREEPKIDAKVLGTINEGTEVEIDKIKPTTNNFYAVYTSTGLEGFCMKDFITVK